VPVYVDTVEWAKPLHRCATLYTIHNLAYQGNWESGALFITGLGWNHFNPGEFEHFGDMNLMKAAIRRSTLLSTVSPTYAREIQTSEYGFGLDGELAARGGDLRGCSTASTSRRGIQLRIRTARALRWERSGRQGGVQSGPAAGDGIA